MENLNNREKEEQINIEEVPSQAENLLAQETELPQNPAEVREENPETFEQVQKAVDGQAEQIEAQADRKGYRGVLSKLAEKGRFVVGTTLLSLTAVLTGCGGDRQPGPQEEKVRISQTAERLLGDSAYPMQDGSFIFAEKNGDNYKVDRKTLKEMDTVYKDYDAKVKAARTKGMASHLKSEGIRILKGMVENSPTVKPEEIPEQVRKAMEEKKQKTEKAKAETKAKIEKKKLENLINETSKQAGGKVQKPKKTSKQELDEEIDKDLQKAKGKQYRSVY